MSGPKSSGSSTSSEAQEGSGSDSKEPTLFMTAHTKGNMRQRVQRRETTWTLDSSGSKMAVSALIHSRGIEFKDDGTLHSLKGAGGGSSKNFFASATATRTNTPSRHTTVTSGRFTPQPTLDGSTQSPYQTLTSYARDFLASHSASLESGRASATLAAPSSLRLLGLLRSNDLGFCSLRTSRGSSATTTETPSGPSSPHWMNWGTMRNGRCLTASISESRRTGKGSSLSDILEESPSQKYFLSDKALKSLAIHDKRHMDAGNGFGASIATIGKEEQGR